MSVPTLILDTNILVSAVRSSLGASHRLVDLIDTGLFDIGLTAPLVLEYEAVCKRLDSANFTSDDVDRFIDSLCRIGKLSSFASTSAPDLPIRTITWSWKRRLLRPARG